MGQANVFLSFNTFHTKNLFRSSGIVNKKGTSKNNQKNNVYFLWRKYLVWMKIY